MVRLTYSTKKSYSEMINKVFEIDAKIDQIVRLDVHCKPDGDKSIVIIEIHINKEERNA